MTYKLAFVNSRKDLNIVLKNNIGQIIITNQRLASKISILKLESVLKIFITSILLIISITNFYNPVGWIFGFFALKYSEYPLISAISYLIFKLGFKNIFKLIKYKINLSSDPEDVIDDENIYLHLILK